MNWKELLSKKEGKKDWFGMVFPFLLGLGVIFLLLSNTHISSKEESESTETPLAQVQTDTYEKELTERVETALSHIQGAGRVSVTLTLDDQGQVTVLQDSEMTLSEEEIVANSGESRSRTEQEQRTETVRDADDEPFVVKERAPTVRGVLILGEGADSRVVKQELLAAVQALLGVSAQHVHIAPYY